MRKVLIPIFIFFSINTFSQTVLLHQDVRKLDFQMPSSGPNYKNFHQLYLNYLLIIPMNEDNEVETNMGKSGIFTIGWRYKRKLSEWFAWGTGLSYANAQYSIKQNAAKQIPNNILHDKEKLKYNNVNLEAYIRFNFGKRGNIIGKFIDLGGYGGYAMTVKHFYEDAADKNSPPSYAGKIKVNEKDLSYVNHLNYGFIARMGVNRWVISASYRLSDLLSDDYKAMVGDVYFPRLAIGLEMGLHK
ncbi:MAG: hypothetical protein L3J74_02660 [Bacteroidales bacterium]|nr:hypothetical protein [Bacteroidales bacterium]